MYAGVEGGTSSSKAVILDSSGKVIGQAVGLHTNHWIIGLEECAKRVNGLLIDAWTSANLPLPIQFESIGMALSGIDSPENGISVRDIFLQLYSQLSTNVYVCNDTIGSMATATDQGGVIIIAGTGSICKYIHPDHSYHRVGGLGHMLGDEGSAYWIALRGIRILLRHMEGLKEFHLDITRLKEVVFDFFKITELTDLLPYFYINFEKSFVSKLAYHIADAAQNGDKMCLKVYEDAGFQLGRMVCGSILPAEDKYLYGPGGLHILCVGQVWKSWNILREGFLLGMKASTSQDRPVKEITLLQLNVGASLGAALLGAEITLKQFIPRDYAANTSVFFHHKFE